MRTPELVKKLSAVLLSLAVTLTAAAGMTADAADTYIVYRTEVSGGPVVNPHKGFVMTTYSPFMFSSGYKYGIGGELDNRAWEMTTVCAGAHYWKDINLSEGVYKWDEVDAMLEECEKHGMTYGIRIIPYSTSIGSDNNNGKDHDLVPQYLYKKGLKHTDAVLRGNSSKHLSVPDWSSSVYIKACKELAKAMAEKYDGDPRVEFIDVRAFGNWGEWHTSQLIGSSMPSEEIQKDMLTYYASVFKKTQLAVPSDVKGAVYEHALSVGITKRNDGMIAIPDREKDLIPAYNANLPTIAENFASYESMLKNNDVIPGGYLKWTPERFRNAIEVGHLTLFTIDQASDCGYKIYSENKELIEETVNRLGYNFTVTSAVRNNGRLEVKIKNTGLAPAFFDIDLTAEITDSRGNKKELFGEPVKIEKGSLKDGSERKFIFEYKSGKVSDDAVICLAMYESGNPLTVGKAPTVKFDNLNTLPNNKLKLVKTYSKKQNASPAFSAPKVSAEASENSVTLSWEPVAGAQKYAVYKVSAGGKLVKAKETKKNTVKFTKLRADTEYKYAVKAYIGGKWTKITDDGVVSVTTK